MVNKEDEAKLKSIKKNIRYAREYFSDNYKRYHDFIKFVFDTSLTENEKTLLSDLQKPTIEFNFLEAYISRLLGEFSKAEPSIIVSNDELQPVDPQVLEIAEGHIRHTLRIANEDSFFYDVYRDLMAGGFSVAKVWTDFEGPMSFDLKICAGRAFDPTLCGFDPLARKPSKSDGAYCFELFPIRAAQFNELFPGVSIDSIRFSKEIEGFNWAYQNQQERILMFAYYYEKVKKQKKLLLLANGKKLFEEDYKEMMEYWKQGGHIDQPAIVIDERFTNKDCIYRYEVIANQILECKEMKGFTNFPLVFFDANSVMLKESENSGVKQITRPYVYQALGIQKLKTFAGQSLANDIENMIQHKFMYAVEGVPENNIDAYIDVQHPSNLPYYAFKRDANNASTDVQVPPPQVIPRVGSPPEVLEIFFNAEKVAQSILGNYDAALGVNENELSGRAIIASATQSNAAAMPIITRFLQGLTNVAQLIVDLIPSINVTQRLLAISNLEGKSQNIPVNGPGQLNMNYPENALRVHVKAGTNFETQMQQSLQALFMLGKEFPWFGQFIQEVGMEVVLENLNFRGADVLKKAAPAYMQKIQQQQAMAQQAQQAQMQNNPIAMRNQVEMIKAQQESKDDEQKNMLEMLQKQLDKRELDQEDRRLDLEEKSLKDEHDFRLSQAAVDKDVHHAKIDEAAHKHALDVRKELNTHQREMNKIKNDANKIKAPINVQ